MNKKLLVRALVGGITAKLFLLSFWVWLHLTGWSFQGKVPVGEFNLAAGATVALFGSAWLAVAVEFTCIFALGAAIGISTTPFPQNTRTLIKWSVIHFLVTGALILLNLWVQCLLGLSRFVLPAYVLLYLLLWFARWVCRHTVFNRSLWNWRAVLPTIPFLLALCVALPILLMWVDRIVFSAPLLSGLLMPYLLFPVVGLCSGISLGKRQGFCLLYPVAAYILYLPIVFWLFNYTALFHADVLFTAALIGNLIGIALRKREQAKEEPHETDSPV